jgi:hypothetical protein
MKKLFSTLLAMSVAACHQQSSSTQVAVSRQSAAVPVTLPYSLVVLGKYNLAVLFRARDAESDSIAFQPQAGCLGTDGHLLEMAFLQVRRDSLRPTTYWIQGKSRFKKTITQFSGSIKLDRVVKQAKYAADSSEWMGYSDYHYYQKLPAYTASGTFVLHEKATRPGSGIFRGTVAIDFVCEANGSVKRQCLTTKTPTQMGELKFQGVWRDNTSKRVQPVLWLGDFISYQGIGAMQDLLVTNVGERGAHLNPKYTHLGWDKAWQNDEWWAASPQPSLGL